MKAILLIAAFGVAGGFLAGIVYEAIRRVR
jgi:hypothetical protein